MYAPLQKQNNAPTARSSRQESRLVGRHPANQPKRPTALQNATEDQGTREIVHADRFGVECQWKSGWRYPRYDFARVPVFHTPVRNMQAKLTLNVTRDAYEQEADRVAAQVMRMSDPQTESTPEVSGHIAGVQRECACGGSCYHGRSEYHSKVQVKASSPDAASGVEAPPIVHEALRSQGQQLDSATRAFMEPRFGHDFSQVRVHTNQKAAESARAVGAKAYTVGNSLVFGAEEYAPGSAIGQRLLTHELVHVVQQQGNASPALQRTPVPTWAGEFDTDLYDTQESIRDGDKASYGLNIRLKFKPGEKVNADKIALVQSAIGLTDGQPINTYTDPKGVTSQRMTDVNAGDSETGLHIDAWPYERTPVVGMTIAENKGELSESVPGKATLKRCGPGGTSFGFRLKGKKPQDANMCDSPRLIVADKVAASQHFETTALAAEGPQKGIYYGSVSWGWEKAAGAKVATKLDLRPASKNIPTGDFARAAELWNQSVTDQNKSVIPLPIGEIKYTSKGSSDLVDEPSHPKPKTLGHLTMNTQVEVIEGIITTNPGWTRVVVIEGKLAGMSGWLKRDALADRQIDIEKAEPKRKK